MLTSGSTFALASLGQKLAKQGYLVFYKKLAFEISQPWTLRMVLKSRSPRAFVQLITKLAGSRKIAIIIDDFQRASVGSCLLCKVLSQLAKIEGVTLILAAERGLSESHEATLLASGFSEKDWPLPAMQQWHEYLLKAGTIASLDELKGLSKRVRLNWFWVSEFMHRQSSFQFVDEISLQNVRSLKQYYRDSKAVLQLLREVDGAGGRLTFPVLASRLGPRVLALKDSEQLRWEGGKVSAQRLG